MVYYNLRLANAILAKAFQSYYLDVNHVYREMHTVLPLGGQAHTIIGDTKLTSVPIPNTEITADKMSRFSFLLEKAIKLEPRQISFEFPHLKVYLACQVSSFPRNIPPTFSLQRHKIPDILSGFFLYSHLAL